MERFFLISFVIVLINSCATEPIIIAEPYVDIEPDPAPISEVSQYASIWERIAKEGSLKYSLNSEVEFYITSYLKEDAKFDELLLKAEPFIFEVIKELEKYHLPIEFALIPFVESSYDPFSVSPSGATGLWQFMPTTARIYGLKWSWWKDDRHNPYLSTKAAVRYLAYLYNRFNRDPLLAIAAYNAGPTFIEKQVKNNKRNGLPTDFWSLNVSRQTQNHIPKFLALVEIINNANTLGIDMPIIKNQKTIELVKVQEQFEILTFSEFIGISPEVFYTLNTGFTKWASPPAKDIEIYLPVELVEEFQSSQASYFENHQMRWVTHKVERGDSLWKIASRYDVTVDDLKLVNSLSKDLLSLDQVILVPLNHESATLFIPYQAHIVSEGDTLWALGKTYGISPNTIASKNGLTINTPLQIGRKLNIGNKSIYRTLEAKQRTILYSVKQGDTLYRIADIFNLDIAKIRELNNLENDSLEPGQIIKLVISLI